MADSAKLSIEAVKPENLRMMGLLIAVLQSAGTEFGLS
jgi:hypothetical protein